MNHSEEAAFWYLRLNGFFAITNFVVHASRDVVRTSDCDVLGVRLPFVYEEVGGQDGDWDPFLVENLNLARPIGIVCEVKSGDYVVRELFREDVLRYSIARLGVTPVDDVGRVVEALRGSSIFTLADGTQVCKLLVAMLKRQGPFLVRGLTEVEHFLQQRVERYPKQKYADRVFFGPVLFQTFIELTAGERGE